MTYLIDTNTLTQSHRAYYPIDIMPTFWGRIKDMFHSGNVISIDKVKNEIYDYKDDLSAWCSQNLDDSFFHDTTSLMLHYREIAEWAYSKNTQYTQGAIETFLNQNKADIWLIAFAKANNITLVTYEVSAVLSKTKIKIPDACLPFEVRNIPPIQLLRELNIMI